LRREPLVADAIAAEIADVASGGVVVFRGRVRDTNEGRSVAGIDYEAHEAVAERVLREIEGEAVERCGARRCRIVHRLGFVAVGEDGVVVVTEAIHRAEAFEAARHAIDELKARAPIWKHEHYADGTDRWLDGTPLDRTPLDRAPDAGTLDAGTLDAGGDPPR
jgi:molybdopterin synthase catalytic subunit